MFCLMILLCTFGTGSGFIYTAGIYFCGCSRSVVLKVAIRISISFCLLRKTRVGRCVTKCSERGQFYALRVLVVPGHCKWFHVGIWNLRVTVDPQGNHTWLDYCFESRSSAGIGFFSAGILDWVHSRNPAQMRKHFSQFSLHLDGMHEPIQRGPWGPGPPLPQDFF